MLVQENNYLSEVKAQETVSRMEKLYLEKLLIKSKLSS